MTNRIFTSILLVLGLSFTFSAQAASKTETNSTTTKMTFSKARAKLKGASLVASFNFTNRMNVKLNGENIQAKSNETFAIGGQYKWDLSRMTKSRTPISAIAGMVYETPREIQRLNSQNFAITGPTPSFSMALLYSNIDYKLTEQASIFGGLNFPIPFESNFADASLTGTLGFQAGLTMKVAKSFESDLTYRMINLTGDNGLDRIDVDGLLLQGRYVF